MRAQSMLLLISVILCMAGGQIMFKYVAVHLRGANFETAAGITRAITEPLLWTAVTLYGLTTVLWLLLLRGENLSRVYPLVVAISLLLVSTASVLVFKEQISVGGYTGAGVIFTGLCILAVFG
jgi:multidrug transporter EmrE-like cation transporter